MLVKRGSPHLQLQPGWSITEEYDGLLTSQLLYEGDRSFASHVPPINYPHPYDWRLFVHKRTINYISTQKIRAIVDYIGITQDPTPGTVEFPGGTGQDPIETHNDFEGLAGTPSHPKNGAKFDPETGEFLGFFDPANSLVGTRSYIVPSILVNHSYHTFSLPYASDIGRISSYLPPGIIVPPGVQNFLLVGMPYRQIGPLFHVTRQYLGSGRRGWNRDIY